VADLVRAEFRLGSEFHAVLLGGVNPGAGAFKDNAAFKLGNGGEDVERQLAARCRGVYVLGERTEMHAALLTSSMMAIRLRTLRASVSSLPTVSVSA
jgi:hypothetical protein